MIYKSTNINKTNNHLSSKKKRMLKKTTIYGSGNPGPGLEQAQKCGRLNWLMGSLEDPLSRWRRVPIIKRGGLGPH
jgi:hypothetical protein